MIEIKGLVKSFGGFKALDGVDMSAPKGSVYGLIGPNGAGKTTLLRCLTGAYRSDGGTVTVDGRKGYEDPEVKKRMFYIPDDLYSFVSAGTKELAAFYSGIYASFDRARYEKLRTVFGIDEKRPIRLLSRGMQKQSAFWLAVSCRPDVLVLDEPVDGLDPAMRRVIWSILMQDVAERNMTVVVSSHNLRELEDVCDRVGVIDHGKMMLEHSLSSLQDNIVKLQIVTDKDIETGGFAILHKTQTGKITTVIVRGSAEETRQKAEKLEPVFYDILPISLEEIFIYELGGADYAKDIIL